MLIALNFRGKSPQSISVIVYVKRKLICFENQNLHNSTENNIFC